MRLDKFLTEKHPDISRVKIQRLIKEGAVKVNGRVVSKPAHKLDASDNVEIDESVILNTAKNLTPEIKPQPEIPLKIVYEDEYIVVVNKQPGLITHPTVRQTTDTLVNALIARYPKIKNVGENPLRPGIVHRLDKDTSGLIVVAKNQEAFLKMKRQFLGRSITKKYFALVEGIPKDKKGVIEYDIRPSTQNRLKKVAIKEVRPPVGGRTSPKLRSVRAAKTEYKVLKTIGSKYTLVEARPFTGRTHQIRVHLSSIGHPIVGDKLYGSKTAASRQFLHAYYLKFTTPNGKELTLELPLPKDLERIIASLTKSN